MGQYHKLYNLDKREQVHPHDIDNGLKLYEQINAIRSTASALFALVANSNARGGGDFPEHPLIGRWAGDRVLVQGDYAEPEDQGYTDPDTLGSFTDISEQVAEMLAEIEKHY